MASSVAMRLSFILLLTLFSSMKTQARDSQFFIKASSTAATTNVVPNQEQPATTTNVTPNKEQPLNNNQQQEPNFLPENENGYGLYGHESGQLPPSSTTATEPTTTATEPTTTTSKTAVSEEPLSKYLPKNYNPVAYVTEPENVDGSNSFAENTYTNNPNNNENKYQNTQSYYNNQAHNQGQQEYQTGEPEYRSYTTNRYSNNNYNYNGGSSFNSGPQELSYTSLMGGVTPNRREDNFHNGDVESSYQPQGMSDTRSLENGKYFYDISNEKYSEIHPYESLKGVRARNEYNDRNYYGNNENSMGGYQNHYEFPNEQNLP